MKQSQTKSHYLSFNPYIPPEYNPSLTPDMPQFHSFPLNIAIFTKYGRWIYILHGNQEKCSSFFATLCTVVHKLQLSFGHINSISKDQVPAKLKKIQQLISNHIMLTIYTLKRANFLYICWVNSAAKVLYHQLNIHSMIDFLHYQLSSCLTGKVNDILMENQTYDPSVNFGKGRAMQNLLHYAVQNGLNSIPLLFNSIPILPLPITTRTIISNILKQNKDQGLQATLLLTTNHIISINKRKNIQLSNKDIFIFFNLIQTQSSLCKSQNWFPICLPGIDSHVMVFCYLNYLSDTLILIMIADQTEIFPILSDFNKKIKIKLIQNKILEKIQVAIGRTIIGDPSLQRMTFVKHFIIINKNNNQMVMSQGQYFGRQMDDSLISDDQFRIYYFIYSKLFQHLLTKRSNRKQPLHIQTFFTNQCFKIQKSQRRIASLKAARKQFRQPRQTNLNSQLLQENIESTHRSSVVVTKKCHCDVDNQFLAGYYDQGSIQIFFIANSLAELQDAKSILTQILKYVGEQENTLFINKYY